MKILNKDEVGFRGFILMDKLGKWLVKMVLHSRVADF
jgi:hypothetical protein